ncbi:MAG TPA: hypothetical protein VD906_08585 [Caulobacteraceae bacterium]|nr:hypothetical protein [Caulobacteraceae bacterium]
MARRATARSKLPLMVTLLAGAAALALAAWLVFGIEAETVDDAGTIRVPPAAEEPLPLPDVRPATAPAP